MESIGDADELSPDEPEGTGPGGPGSAQQIWTAVWSAEALSIAAFTVSATSLLGSGLLQVLSFSLFTTLPDSAADGTRTIAVAHGILAVAGAVLALLALLPRDTERAAWVLGFAGGALIVSLVVCALAVVGWLMYEPIDAGPVAFWPG